jgi:hypothetical protein
MPYQRSQCGMNSTSCCADSCRWVIHLLQEEMRILVIGIAAFPHGSIAMSPIIHGSRKSINTFSDTKMESGCGNLCLPIRKLIDGATITFLSPLFSFPVPLHPHLIPPFATYQQLNSTDAFY